MRMLILSYRIQEVIPNVYTNFQNPRYSTVVPEKSLTKIVGEKEKWTNKGMISMRMLILSYTIQQIIPNVCTQFQNPKCSSS